MSLIDYPLPEHNPLWRCWASGGFWERVLSRRWCSVCRNVLHPARQPNKLEQAVPADLHIWNHSHRSDGAQNTCPPSWSSISLGIFNHRGDCIISTVQTSTCATCAQECGYLATGQKRQISVMGGHNSFRWPPCAWICVVHFLRIYLSFKTDTMVQEGFSGASKGHWCLWCRS